VRECLAPALRSKDALVVSRSTRGLNSGCFGGRSVDGRPAQRTCLDTVDELKHIAKVKVDQWLTSRRRQES